MGELKKGVYRHYKGKGYEVIGLANHSDTLEQLVVYRTLYGDFSLWVRPVEQFCEQVIVNEKKVPRFEFIKTGV